MTLMEILVTFAVLAILAVLAIFLIRPEEQFAKANDTRRRNDLNELRKIFESWMTDKGCYPKTTDVCFNAIDMFHCNICTSNASSPSLGAYTTSNICDPDSPLRDYLYEVQGDTNCPSAYIVYSKLAATYNADYDTFHCTQFHGCGPPPNYGYDYMVTSPNAAISVTSNYYCYSSINRCSSCGQYTSCLDAQRRGVCLSIYGSKPACCTGHPSAEYCP